MHPMPESPQQFVIQESVLDQLNDPTLRGVINTAAHCKGYGFAPILITSAAEQVNDPKLRQRMVDAASHISLAYSIIDENELWNIVENRIEELRTANLFRNTHPPIKSVVLLDHLDPDWDGDQ